MSTESSQLNFSANSNVKRYWLSLSISHRYRSNIRRGQWGSSIMKSGTNARWEQEANVRNILNIKSWVKIWCLFFCSKNCKHLPRALLWWPLSGSSHWPLNINIDTDYNLKAPMTNERTANSMMNNFVSNFNFCHFVAWFVIDIYAPESPEFKKAFLLREIKIARDF